MSEIKNPPARRIFIRSRDRISHIFSISQAGDASIYCSSPDFFDAKWLSLQISDNRTEIITSDAIGEGKLSLHGSGMAAIRPHDDPKGHKLVVKGNHLLRSAAGKIGARHLFTVFMREPKSYPESSPLFNRTSDYCLEAAEDLRPFALVFFAVPQQGLTVHFEFSLHQDDMVNVPNDFLGLHGFGLRFHDVFWFAYRTRHMDRWPKYAHICYHDGYGFPIFIGTGLTAYRLEFRQPQYVLNGKDLEISCHRSYPDDYSN